MWYGAELELCLDEDLDNFLPPVDVNNLQLPACIDDDFKIVERNLEPSYVYQGPLYDAIPPELIEKNGAPVEDIFDIIEVLQELRSGVTKIRFKELRAAIIMENPEDLGKYQCRACIDKSYPRLSDAYVHVFEQHLKSRKLSCNRAIYKTSFPRRSSLNCNKKRCRKS